MGILHTPPHVTAGGMYHFSIVKFFFFVRMCLWNEVDIVFLRKFKEKGEKMNMDAVRFYIVHQIG